MATNHNSASPKLFFGSKKPEYYNGILIKADTSLHEQLAQEIQHILPKGGSILDFGAGEGALSQRLTDLGYKVIAADVNAKDFKCTNVEFHSLDFNNTQQVLAFCEKHKAGFDVVLGIEVIEHLENQWEYVRLLKSLLKVGGHVIVTTPNISSWLSRYYFFRSGRFHQFEDSDVAYGHITPISEWELRHILEKEGFEDVRIVPAGTLPRFWIRRSIRWLFINMMLLFIKPIMKGHSDGWCLMAVAKKDGSLRIS
jgi:cyclopropane fatty-acyl-phospholipid synthase-like methyltransferase